MNLLDAAAYHQLVLEHDEDLRLEWYRLQHLRFLRSIRPPGVPFSPDTFPMDALSPDNVRAAVAAHGPEIERAMRGWAEFLTREGLLDRNPFDESQAPP